MGTLEHPGRTGPDAASSPDRPGLGVLEGDSMVEATAAHTRAGECMSGADMIIQVLVDEGVDTLFGYSGGAVLPAYDALYRYNAARSVDEQIRLIIGANEQGAGFMAAGYARATGKVGALIVTSGPGATNCVTPVRDSMADSVPVVLICGQVPRSSIGTDAFQEAPVFNIMSACSKHVFLVENEKELEATVRTAFAIARSGRPGPVVIDVPKDVQDYEGVFKGEGMLELKGYGKRLEQQRAARLPQDKAAAFFGLLGRSKRPLFYVGGGVIISGAAAELRAFSSRFSIPVVTSLMGIGSVDTTDPLALGMLGMHGTAYANYAVEDCDFLIAVGTRFDDRVAGNVEKFAPHAKVVHIDIDAAEIGKVKAVDWACVGDAKQVLAELLAAGANFEADFSKWANRVLELKKRHCQRYNQDAEIIQPEYVLDTLNQLVRGDAVVCTGVGQHQMFSSLYLDFREPRTFITSGCMGTMGFGLPASIGAKLARPDKLVIDVDGDGGMRMNVGELETAATFNVPVKIVLLNNEADGMVWQWQGLYYGRRFSGTDKKPRTKDFVKEAQANGFQFARRVTDQKDVRPALEALLAYDGPALVEFMTDREAFVYPMVGPGDAYDKMIVGPHITSREATKQ